MQRERERKTGGWWGLLDRVIRASFQLLSLPPDMALVCRITRFSINDWQVSGMCLVEGLMLTEWEVLIFSQEHWAPETHWPGRQEPAVSGPSIYLRVEGLQSTFISVFSFLTTFETKRRVSLTPPSIRRFRGAHRICLGHTGNKGVRKARWCQVSLRLVLVSHVIPRRGPPMFKRSCLPFWDITGKVQGGPPLPVTPPRTTA